MTDEWLRALERAFHESGAVEAEAAWLLERVRVDELTQERLDLSAFLSSPAARLSLCERAPPVVKMIHLATNGFRSRCWAATL